MIAGRFSRSITTNRTSGTLSTIGAVQAKTRELVLVGVNRGHLKIGRSAEGALIYFVKSSRLAPLLRDGGAKGPLRNRDDSVEG